MGTFLESTILWGNFANVFADFVARDSAEASAEASVDLAEASVSAESQFRPFRSFTTYLPSLVFRHFALEIWSQWLNNSVRLTIDVKIHKCVFKMRLKNQDLFSFDFQNAKTAVVCFVSVGAANSKYWFITNTSLKPAKRQFKENFKGRFLHLCKLFKILFEELYFVA